MCIIRCRSCLLKPAVGAPSFRVCIVPKTIVFGTTLLELWKSTFSRRVFILVLLDLFMHHHNTCVGGIGRRYRTGAIGCFWPYRTFGYAGSWIRLSENPPSRMLGE
jgi:hypothetical protein